MVGEAGLFTNRLMLFVGEDGLIGPPEVGVNHALAIVLGYSPPQLLTGRLTSSADHTGDDLPGGFTQRKPDPALVAFVTHKRPQLVEFELSLFGFGRLEQRVFEGR